MAIKRKNHIILEDNTTKRDFSLVYSILIHALLVLGLYFISKPHLPKTPENIEVSMVSNDMLEQMTHNAQKSQVTAHETAVSTETSKSTPITKKNIHNDIKNTKNTAKTAPALIKKQKTVQPQQTTVSSPTQKAQNNQPKSTRKKTSTNNPSLDELNDILSKPKVVKPLINKTKRKSDFNPKTSKKVTKVDADLKIKSRQIAEEKKQRLKRIKRKQAESEEMLKRETEKRLAEKNRKLREIKKQRQKELDAAKRLEKSQAHKKSERLRKTKEAIAKRNAQIRKEQEKINRKKSNSISMNTNNSKPSKKEPSQAQTNNIKNRFDGLIQAKIDKSVNSKPFIKKQPVSVRIRLSSAGNILSVRITKSTGDAELDKLYMSAVRESGPLPVPDDRSMFNKHFKNITIDLER